MDTGASNTEPWRWARSRSWRPYPVAPLPCCSWEVMMGLIWGTDKDAEMEKRETGGSLPLQLQETTLVPWDVPSLLRPGLAVGLVSSPEQAVSTPRAGRQG